VKKTYYAAIAVAAFFGLWLLSGQFGEGHDGSLAPSLAEERAALTKVQEDNRTRVRASVFEGQQQTADVVVRGRTQADRTVIVRTQTTGRVVAVPVNRGDRVAEGDVLCQLAPEAREARIEEARQAVKQAEIDFQGARRLAEQGLQSATAIASAEARVAATTAELRQRELDLTYATVRAPFTGLVEERPAEVGELLQVGGHCATLVDPDPMLLVGQIAERDVGRVQLGGVGIGRLLTGEQVNGEISFIARTADPRTRTFRVEVRVPNGDYALRDGITTELRLPVARVIAHHLPAALLSLDDEGAIGVRILNGSNVVQFVNVSVIDDSTTGVWVTGLPERATVITVGQELVSNGEQVDVAI